MGRIGMVVVAALVLIGSLLYYSVHRQDLREEVSREQRASEALQARAVAVGRMAAALSVAGVQGGDQARLQEWIGQASRVDGLADVLLISTGDHVLASSNPDFLGHEMHDAGWTAIRAQRREWVFVDVPVPGQERVTVFEPVVANDTIVAWIRVSFLRARLEELVRAPEERALQVAGLLIPIGVILAGAVWWAMRISTSRMQQQIQSVVSEAMADRPAMAWGEGAGMAGHAMSDAGTHTAA